MAVTHSPSSHKYIQKLREIYPQIVFTEGDTFMWSPEKTTVYYPREMTIASIPSILHELGHALLGHTIFAHDVDLLKMERDAWQKALEIAKDFEVEIAEDHIEKCLDTYRDWLYARSLCPYCKQCGIQTKATEYSCVFCGRTWAVSKSRLCRVSRRVKSKTT